MENTYFQKELFVASVDERDHITGAVERWKAHTEGILHRGFTVVLIYQGKYLLQYRKHIAFDLTWDLTFSSHQRMIDGVLQADEEAIDQALGREWNLTKDDREDLVYKGKIYYKAKDPKSMYTEHEFDYIYSCVIKKLPIINPEFAYGYELVKVEKETIQKNISKFPLAPWVETLIQEKKLL